MISFYILWAIIPLLLFFFPQQLWVLSHFRRSFSVLLFYHHFGPEDYGVSGAVIMLIRVNYSSVHAFAIYRELGFINICVCLRLLHNQNITYHFISVNISYVQMFSQHYECFMIWDAPSDSFSHVVQFMSLFMREHHLLSFRRILEQKLLQGHTGCEWQCHSHTQRKNRNVVRSTCVAV